MNIYKLKKLLLILPILIGVGYWQWDNTRMVHLRITPASSPAFTLKMPKRDKKRMEYLFRSFLLDDHAIYTLLGSKPMSLGAYRRPFASSDFLDVYHTFLPDNLRMYWSWKTWLKYQHLFVNPKFALWAEQSPWIPEGDVILLVNKPKANSIIKNYAQDFYSVLKKNDLCIEDLLKSMNTKPLLVEGLRGHEALIGTLLGYGRENAWLFHRRSQGEIIFLSGFRDEGEGFKKVSEWGSFFGRNLSNDISVELFSPSFVADRNSKETQDLKKSYSLMKKKILEVYEGKDFLETTLSLLHP